MSAVVYAAAVANLAVVAWLLIQRDGDAPTEDETRAHIAADIDAAYERQRPADGDGFDPYRQGFLDGLERAEGIAWGWVDDGGAG